MRRFLPRPSLWKYYTMLAVVHTIGRMPLRWRYAVSRVVSDRVYAWRPSIRNALRDNMRHVLGPGASEAEIDRVARQCSRNTGRYYADVVGMHRMNVQEFYEHDLKLDGIEYVKEAQAQGRGVVMASAHYANPEFATQGLAAAGIHVFALVEPLRPPQLHDLMYRLRNVHGHHYESATFGGVKAALDWLRKGGVLAILVDRDIQKRGIELEFCGAKARFPTGAVDLAIRSNSVLIPGWVRRLGGFRVHADIGPPLELIRTGNHDEDLRVNTQRLLALFEAHLKRDPGQWSVVERVWPEGRTANSKEQTAKLTCRTIRSMGKADLHIHTRYGDGMATVPELLRHVEERGDLDVIAVTEHDTLRAADEARELHARASYRFGLVCGMEVTTLDGHLLALYIDEPVPSFQHIEPTLEAIHRQGGLAIVPHPLSWLTRSVGERTFARVAAVQNDGVHFDGIEERNQSPAGRISGSRVRRLNRERLRLAAIGSSDAHFLAAVGCAFTTFEGTTAADLRRVIESRATIAEAGSPPSLAALGYRNVALQQWRGMMATPRNMGWAPTVRSFFTSHLTPSPRRPSGRPSLRRRGGGDDLGDGR